MSLSPTKSKPSLKDISDQDILYVKSQADAGLATAQFAIGCCYAQGKFVEKSLAEAIKYFQMAVDQGLREAFLILGDTYKAHGSIELAQQCYKGAFEYYKELADHGNAVAQATLGTFYERGIGTAVNLKEAFHFYELSAKQNNSQGLYLVGRCYEEGKGTEASLDEALRYYKLAAGQGYPLAKYNLAICLINNDLNYKEAMENLQEVISHDAAVSSSTKADCYYYLGCCYAEGKGVNPSKSEASHYFKLAMLGGNVSASFHLNE